MSEQHTAVYPQRRLPVRYDQTHFLCYLNETEAECKADEDAEAVQGYSYTGDMEDGSTLVECDELDRSKLINAVIRSKYLQTEEDAIKTHQLQVLLSETGLVELDADKISQYQEEWAAFEEFRSEAIELVDDWLS